MAASEKPNQAPDLNTLISDLTQYLQYQKSLGVTHMEINEASARTIASWGTRAWKQHRILEQGPKNSKFMIVDSDGNFFKGKPGRLLAKILTAMHLSPEQVYICNAADANRIKARISVHSPKVIIALGQKACDLLFKAGESLNRIQGEFHSFEGVMVMPTRHPKQLLTDPGLKRGVWEDMQKVMKQTGLDHDS